MDTPSTSTGGDTAFVCYQCDKAFTHRDARDRHVRLVHRHQKLYQCPICGTEFGRKDNYDSHRRVCKEEEDLAYLCLDCNNVFSLKRDLVRHACKNKRRKKRRIPHPPALDLSPRKRGRPAVVEEETEVTVPGGHPRGSGLALPRQLGRRSNPFHGGEAPENV
ncbi:hypothetical protein ACOMHN_052750 [Nucella lapillus]